MYQQEVDTSVPSIARTYDAALGGKDNFEVDREALRTLQEVAPDLTRLTWANRMLLTRFVSYLAARTGITQILDVGAGLPTMQNTHEIAQRWNSKTHVVYVDNDPAVNAYGRALLEDNVQTWFATADLTEPEELFETKEVSKLDLDQPIALIQCATLMHLDDERDPWDIMRRYVNLLPSGSYVAISHGYNPADGGAEQQRAEELEHQYLNTGFKSGRFRTYDEVLRLFDGLELVEPGVVPFEDWWPAGPRLEEPGVERFGVGGMARKP